MRTIYRTVVSVLIFSKDGKLLMGMKDPKDGGVYADCWHIPGGGVDEGETQEQALRREILEEVGIDIAGCKVTLADDQGSGETEKTLKDTGEKVMCHMKFYVYRVDIDKNADEIETKLSDDLVKLEWVDPAKLDGYKLTPPSITLFQRLGYLPLRLRRKGQVILDNVQTCLTAHARPLDLALYNSHFNKGSQEAVVKALAAYQNEDGGFGNGIEPDFQMPDSSALGSTLAFQYLNRLNLIQDDTLVHKGLDYFIQTYDHQKNGWDIVPEEVDGYPHAPWWDYKAAMAGFGWGNPAAEILGYLLKYRTIVQDDTFLKVLTSRALQRLQELTELDNPDFHELLCYTRLYQQADQELQVRLYDKLASLIKKVVSTNPDEWNSYGAAPLTFVKSPDSPFVSLFDKDIINANLAHLKQTIVDGDHWDPTWDWGNNYPEAWSKAKQAWSGKLTVENMTVLRAFGEITV